jgi:cyclopropane-fatty-acyl-phospholipid synthase
MQYTCAYFSSRDEDLDTAQRRKMDYICRKLRLKPGERLLDIGCGWGSLLIHAARNYGVQGVGVTLARNQAEWATRAIREAGLEKDVTILCGDYRQLPFREEFDKATSVGVVEEAGRKQIPAYFRRVYSVLKPRGAYLHHSITIRPGAPLPIWTPFVVKYVFPGGELHTLNEALDHATRAGFEIRDVENLREHYPLTLERWVRQLEAAADDVRRLTGDVNYRIYRLYMAGSQLGFGSGVYNLNQSLLVKSPDGDADIPLTRADWYC